MYAPPYAKRPSTPPRGPSRRPDPSTTCAPREEKTPMAGCSAHAAESLPSGRQLDGRSTRRESFSPTSPTTPPGTATPPIPRKPTTRQASEQTKTTERIDRRDREHRRQRDRRRSPPVRSRRLITNRADGFDRSGAARLHRSTILPQLDTATRSPAAADHPPDTVGKAPQCRRAPHESRDRSVPPNPGNKDTSRPASAGARPSRSNPSRPLASLLQHRPGFPATRVTSIRHVKPLAYTSQPPLGWSRRPYTTERAGRLDSSR